MIRSPRAIRLDRRAVRKCRPEIFRLEGRLLLCADGDEGPDDLGTYPAIVSPLPTQATDSTGGASAAAATGLALPVLNSLSGAQATLYLDFSGDFVSYWQGYSNINTPAFDTDGNAASLSQSEVDAITNIWKIVAENYAPYKINVTTVDPRTLTGYTGGSSQIDVGGNGSWTGGTYGGIAQVGGYAGSTASNPVRGFVFPANLGNGAAWYTGQAASHESGHTMGLQHQSAYSGSTKTDEYQSGPGDGTAPIMGVSYYVQRGMWWYGQSSISSSTYQNDMAVIGSNSFGFKADDAGSTVASAAPLVVSSNQVNTTGLLTSMSDVDAWSFTTAAGSVSLTVAAPTYGNLYPKIELLDSTGSVVAGWQDPNGPSVTWSGTLGAGTYDLVVASHGISAAATANNYGFDVGTYTITGTVGTPSSYVAAPTGLTATAVSTSEIDLKWTDNATNETGYNVERSSDGGAHWTLLTPSGLPANSTAYNDTGLPAGTTYTYRVRAFNGPNFSDYSNQASAKTTLSPPVAPASLTAATVSSTKIHLAWTFSGTNATGFAIDRAIYGKNGRLGGWSQLTTVAANLTAYDDTTVTSSKTYDYRIRAYNSAGYSPYTYSSPSSIKGGQALSEGLDDLDFSASVVAGSPAGAGGTSLVIISMPDSIPNRNGAVIIIGPSPGDGAAAVSTTLTPDPFHRKS